jgi:hypothetical protein
LLLNPFFLDRLLDSVRAFTRRSAGAPTQAASIQTDEKRRIYPPDREYAQDSAQAILEGEMLRVDGRRRPCKGGLEEAACGGGSECGGSMQALDEIGVDRALRLEWDFGEQVLDEFLELIRHHLELAQISYARSVLPGPAMSGVALSLIQGSRCVPSFRDARHAFIEAMLALRVRSAVPLDWAELAKGDPKLRRLFDEARDAGLGRQGLTIQVLGRGNSVCALINVISDESEGVWDRRRLELTRDLVRIAHFVHQRACDHYAER